MPTYRYFEIALYSLLNFLPYVVLALYPFRRKLRFSKVAVAVLVGFVAAIQVMLGILAATSVNPAPLSAMSTVVYGVFYFTVVKARLGKSIFTLLMLSNLANFVVISSKCLEGILFPALAAEKYHWSHSVCMVIVELAVLIPLFIYFVRHYAPALEKTRGGSVWRYMWLIPATFYLIWYHSIYFSGMSSMELALRIDNTLWLLFINAGATLIYHVVIMLTNEQSKNLVLQEREHMLRMQQKQYENIQERIAEARRERHDMRQHLRVIARYVNDDNKEGLKQYLSGYEKSLSDYGTLKYCENYAVNALLQYFAAHAQELGTSIDFSVSLPAQTGIPDEVLTVILGNLLENAVEATAVQKEGEKRISVRGKNDEGAVFFYIENTFEGKLKKNSGGLFLSTKHEGRGIGLGSVRNIVSQYNGLIEINNTDNVFAVSVMLEKP